MALKPWYTVIQPREDLRSGRPLDAAEFAVHLDKVRDGNAAEVYVQPEQFFERTFLTQTLLGLAGEVVRRLAGETHGASAVFNLATQFGGGKTHALTLLYHLARHGPQAEGWPGVRRILDQAGVAGVPQAAVAVFVGTEFDSLSGRGGADGTPLRRTPWGEIAYQLGGEAALALVREHEASFTEPKGDVIRALLPRDRPCLILMDEIINYVSTYRRYGYGNALYNFIQALSETARGMTNVVLVVSIPKSEIEFTADDIEDEQRFKKMLDRVGKPYMMSAESETAEIIRRRLFEWDLRALGQNGRVQLPREALDTCAAYAQWVQTHRQSLPQSFPIDRARDSFSDTYPFHPALLSVFERKWQSLPRFQQTRGVLRLLAQWVARAYREGYSGAYRDPLIDLGTAPLDDALFRSALFEQLGENRLEAPVTTDICGQKDSHAVRLDDEAGDEIRKARLHRKVASAIFFESNGGQSQHYATLPEVRLAVAAPDLSIANVDTVLEALVPPGGACYYLTSNHNRYRFSTKPNLTRVLADRKGGVQKQQINERVQAEIQKVFAPLAGVERVFFPASSAQVPNQAAITLVVLEPDQRADDPATLARIEQFTREYGSTGRTYKSGLIWVLPSDARLLHESLRTALAWEALSDEQHDLDLEPSEKDQIASGLKQARETAREAVWRTYHTIALLDKNNSMQVRDLGLIHSSSASSPTLYIVNRLKLDGDIEESIGPNFLARNWPAMTEWSTRAVRDAFFASPRFPRLLNGAVVRDTIARGVANKLLAYVGKASDGSYAPFHYGQTLSANEIDLSDDMFIIRQDIAEAYLARAQAPQALRENGEPWPAPAGSSATTSPVQVSGEPQTTSSAPVGMPLFDFGNQPAALADNGTSFPATPKPAAPTRVRQVRWRGDVPAQKWMTFYTRVLSRFAASKGVSLRLTVQVELTPEQELTPQQIEEMRAALRELGLDDSVQTNE